MASSSEKAGLEVNTFEGGDFVLRKEIQHVAEVKNFPIDTRQIELLVKLWRHPETLSQTESLDAWSVYRRFKKAIERTVDSHPHAFEGLTAGRENRPFLIRLLRSETGHPGSSCDSVSNSEINLNQSSEHGPGACYDPTSHFETDINQSSEAVDESLSIRRRIVD